MIANRICRRLLPCSLIVLGGIVLFANSAASFEDRDCRSITPIKEEVVEQFRADETQEAVRSRAIQRISQDAVAEVVGVSIRSSRSMQAQATNDQIDERFQERAVSQSTGLIRYKITNEQILDDAGGRSLSVRADAEVCVPKSPAVLREVVFIGPTLSSRGENLTDLRSAIAEVFSASPSFVVTDDSDGFHDVVVTGRINEVEIRDVKAGAETLLSGKPAILGAGSAPSEFQNIRVSVTVEAKLEDGTVVSRTLNESRNASQGHDAKDAITSFVGPLLERVALDLRGKLIADRSLRNGGTATPAAGDSPSLPKW